MRHHFSKVELQNLGPVKRATLELAPLHALIGPNDAGKTTTLRGLQTMCDLLKGDPQSFQTRFAEKGSIDATGPSFRFTYSRGRGFEYFDLVGGALASPPDDRYAEALLLRLDPDELRVETDLIADNQRLSLLNERGRGLGALLDAINARDVQKYLSIEHELVALFPSVAGFRLWTTPSGRRMVGVRLKNGAEIRPDRMSEGMLYFLAFAVLKHVSPVALILVEEPENGLHPARIADVMNVLKEVSKTTQIVLATHSPLVVNELEPSQVTLVRRTEAEGTTFTPISQTLNFEKRSKIYALGELWLSYANGIDDRLESTTS